MDTFLTIKSVRKAKWDMKRNDHSFTCLGYTEREGQCFPTPENSITGLACSEHSNPTENPTGLRRLNEFHSATKREVFSHLRSSPNNSILKNQPSATLKRYKMLIFCLVILDAYNSSTFGGKRWPWGQAKSGQYIESVESAFMSKSRK